MHTFCSWHTTLLLLAMEVFVHCQDKQKMVAADQTKVPPLTGPECYFCRGNKNCSMPLENLNSVTCTNGSICAFINVTAEFPGSASSADIARGCAPDTVGADVCISSAEYIEDILIPKFPEVKDTIVSNSGAACFCSEDFCNAEIPEGLLCYTCDGEDECSQSLGLLLVETCPLNSFCGIVNITADLGVPEPAKDVKRGCFSNIPATGCITSKEYIQVATAHDANITDVIISTEGMACFCDEDFCNTEMEDLSESSTVPSAAPLETTLFEQASEPSVRATSSTVSNSPPDSSGKVALWTAIPTFVLIVILFVVVVLVFRDFTTWKGSQRTSNTRKPGNFLTYLLSKTPLRILPRMKNSTNAEGLTTQSSTQSDWESKC